MGKEIRYATLLFEGFRKPVINRNKSLLLICTEVIASILIYWNLIGEQLVANVLSIKIDILISLVKEKCVVRIITTFYFEYQKIHYYV